MENLQKIETSSLSLCWSWKQIQRDVYKNTWYSPEGHEKVPPGSPYSGHGSPLRTLVSSSHGTPLETASPQLVRHRQDSENTVGISPRRSSDVGSSLLESPALVSSERVLRRLEYSPQQGRFNNLSLENIHKKIEEQRFQN